MGLSFASVDIRLRNKHRSPHLSPRRTSLQSLTPQTIDKVLVLVCAVFMFTINTGTEFCLGSFAARVDYPPSTLLCFKGVGYGTLFLSARLTNFLQLFVHSPGSSIHANFLPILRGYVISDVQENGVLTGLFDEDLTLLDKESNWRITYERGSKRYKIERDPEYDDWLVKSGYDVGN